MPELPEVETVRAGLAPVTIGQIITNIIIRQEKLRYPIPENLPQLLHKQHIKNIERRSKYLLVTTSHGTLIIHLGMSGCLCLVDSDTTIAKHDHVDFIFKNGTCLRYNDPRRFGLILWTDQDPHQHKLLSKLGPEPLTAAFSSKYLFTQTQKRKIGIKQLIMDSHAVVGVGNIYANEALFKAGIHPLTICHQLELTQIQTLTKEIKKILRRAIKQGGTTLKDFKNSEGKPGYFQQTLLVYGRKNQPCKTCSAPLEEIRISGRSSVFCPHCQTP
jgi:formamidopyrimidine-DNA glycosylase